MGPFSELHVSSQTIYIISTDMAVSSADFTAFFQDEGKSIKRGENLYKSAHVESCSYSKGKLVGSVSQRRENVMASVTCKHGQLYSAVHFISTLHFWYKFDAWILLFLLLSSTDLCIHVLGRGRR